MECASDLPSGTVALLFTDIEGSTNRWEHDPGTMSRELRTHEEILGSCIRQRGGYVFKTMGDAFCAAFSEAGAALDSAIAAQRGLARAAWKGGPLKVRIGMHAGTVEARDGDYFGPTVNKASRLAAAGHGGQILLSEAARALVKDRLPEGIGLRDLGPRRLKDIPGQERIYQVLGEGLEGNFPALKALDARPNNLPPEATSFVGRAEELSQAASILETSRLLTLAGPGGCGKTRLALKLGAHLADRFEDGTWFIDLAPLPPGSDPAIAAHEAMGILADPGKTPAMSLAAALAEREDLVILDNCEHLVEASARLADALLKRCPRLHVLSTSREPLEVASEVVLRVEPLSCPAAGDRELDLASLSQYDAVRLFIERAKAARLGFIVDSANAPWIAEICHRLDGIPLAIELAAARVARFSVEEIAGRLGDRFALLQSGLRTVLPRQRTLHALIDWSWDLLGEDERSCLARLSVLPGPFDLETLESMVGAVMAETASGLVEKSLISRGEEDGSSRFRLLEIIREFARMRLSESGSEEEAEEALIARYHGLTRDLHERIFEHGGPALLRLVTDQKPNILASVEAAERLEDLRALSIAGQSILSFAHTGEISDMCELADRHLSPWFGKSLPPSPELAVARLAASKAMISPGRWPEAFRHAESALDISRKIKDSRLEIRCLVFLAGLKRGGGFPFGFGGLNPAGSDWEASRRLYKEAEALALERGDERGALESRGGQAIISLLLGEEGVEERIQTLEKQALEHGNELALVWLSINHASILRRTGRLETATRHAENALKRATELGELQIRYMATTMLGEYSARIGDFDAAVSRQREALAFGRSMGAPWAIRQGRYNLLGALALRNEGAEFTRLFLDFLVELSAKDWPEDWLSSAYLLSAWWRESDQDHDGALKRLDIVRPLLERDCLFTDHFLLEALYERAGGAGAEEALGQAGRPDDAGMAEPPDRKALAAIRDTLVSDLGLLESAR